MGIDLARLGPAIFIGSVNVLPSDLNDVGGDDLLLRLLITSFNNFQVVLRLFLAFSKFEIVVFSFDNANKMGEFVFVGFILRLRRCGR